MSGEIPSSFMTSLYSSAIVLVFIPGTIGTLLVKVNSSNYDILLPIMGIAMSSRVYFKASSSVLTLVAFNPPFSITSPSSSTSSIDEAKISPTTREICYPIIFIQTFFPYFFILVDTTLFQT